MADSTLILGLAGVAGTILGTGLGAGIAARTAVTVERHREEREQRVEAHHLRAAARLVWLDLAQADANLAWCVARNRWTPTKGRIPLQAWEQHRDRLALGITSAATWTTIAESMAVLSHTATTLEASLNPGELPPGVVDSLAEARHAAVTAAGALAVLAGMDDQTSTA